MGIQIFYRLLGILLPTPELDIAAPIPAGRPAKSSFPHAPKIASGYEHRIMVEFLKGIELLDTSEFSS
jgi:hypothetical protein